MAVVTSYRGTSLDISLIQLKLGKLRKLISDNQVSSYKSLSTTILSNLTSVNTVIQASSSNIDLSNERTISP
jgi:hypothetical protein